MDSLFNCLPVENDFMYLWDNVVLRTNAGLSKTIEIISDLNRTLVNFNTNLNRFGETQKYSANAEVSKMELKGEDTEISGFWKSRPSFFAPKDINTDPGSFIDEVRVLTGSTQKLATTFDAFSPKVRSVLSETGSILDRISGAADLISKAKSGNSVIDLIPDTIEVILGAEAIANVSALAGPPGWLLGALAVAIAGYTYNEAEERRKQVAFQETQKDVKNSLQTFVMSERDAEEYILGTKMISKQAMDYWKPPIDPIKENVQKYGADAYSLHFPVPVATADNLQVRPVFNPGIKHDQSQIVPEKQTYLEKTIDLQQRLSYQAMTNGIDGFNTVARDAIMHAQKHDKIYKTHTLDLVVSAIQEVQVRELTQANGSIIVAKNTRSARGREMEHQANSDRSAGRKSIAINLNRPMIENFTINVKDKREGLNDFRHKVEEVLLEILNSANVI